MREFARIAAEFFELDGDITFSMREEKGKSFVSINFRITRVKNFTTLPYRGANHLTNSLPLCIIAIRNKGESLGSDNGKEGI